MVRDSREAWKTYKNVFDNASLLILEKLKSQHKLDELKSPISIGKEANIFTAKVGSKTIIAKIYRVENCNFNKMYSYICTDPRYPKLTRVRRQIIFLWAQREYHNLLRAAEVIRVPKPLAQRNNIILMEQIGKSEPAPKLKDVLPKNIEKFFKDVVNSTKKLYQSGLIHGDLSEYNILNYRDKPVFIDFSQGTQVDNHNARELIERDVKNICRFFGKHIKVDPEAILKEIVNK
ncbi:MAG: serine protein kinase RIO [Nanoarchaeota archaeon]